MEHYSPKPIWTHPLFKQAIRKAWKAGKKSFELEGKTYDILKEDEIYLTIKVRDGLGVGQVEKDKINRGGAEWH